MNQPGVVKQRQQAALKMLSIVLSWLCLALLAGTLVLFAWTVISTPFKDLSRVKPDLVFVPCLLDSECRQSYWDGVVMLVGMMLWGVPGFLLVVTLFFRLTSWFPVILHAPLQAFGVIVSALFEALGWVVQALLRAREGRRMRKVVAERSVGQATSARRIGYRESRRSSSASLSADQQRIADEPVVVTVSAHAAVEEAAEVGAARSDEQPRIVKAKSADDIKTAIALAVTPAAAQVKSASGAVRLVTSNAAAVAAAREPGAEAPCPQGQEERSGLPGGKPVASVGPLRDAAGVVAGSASDALGLVRDTRHDRWLVDLLTEGNRKRVRSWAAEEREEVMGASTRALTLREAAAEYIAEELIVWTGIQAVLPDAPEIRVPEGARPFRPVFPTSGGKQLPAWRFKLREMQRDPDLLALIQREGRNIMGHPDSAGTDPAEYHPGIMYVMSQLAVPLSTVKKENLLGGHEVPEEAIVTRGQRRKFVYFWLPYK